MIILFTGENSFDSWNEFSKLRDELSKNKDSEIKLINGDEASSISEIAHGLEMTSFFSTKSVVIIKRLFKNRSKKILEEFSDYISTNPSSEFILWEEGEVDKRLKLYKTITKIGEVRSFKNMKESELLFWVRKRFETENMRIADRVAEKFISRVGTNKFIIDSEITKLVEYLRALSENELTERHIGDISAYNPEDSIWEFIDTLTSKDTARSLSIIETLVSEVGDYQLFLGLIVRQLRLLLLIKLSLPDGRQAGNSDYIAKSLGEHPFVIKKLYSSIHRFELGKIKKAFERLLNLDKMIKQGSIEAKLGLDLFVLAF